MVVCQDGATSSPTTRQQGIPGTPKSQLQKLPAENIVQGLDHQLGFGLEHSLAQPGTEPGVDGSGGGGMGHKGCELEHKKGSNPVNLRLKYHHLTKYRHISKTVHIIPTGV